jgi:hypothetical protein
MFMSTACDVSDDITALTVQNNRLTRDVVEQRVNIVTPLYDGLISSN